MNIGVVTASYPRVDGEHAGNFVASHAAALRAAGHHVDVIGAHTIASELFYGAGAPEELERGGLRTHVAAARFCARLTVEVARRARGWDLIIAHWLVPSALSAIVGAALARSARSTIVGARRPPAFSTPATPPILAIAHGGDIHTLRRLRLLAPTLYALRVRGVRLAFVSDELRAIACAAAPALAPWLAGALVQPMGIDVEHFAALRSSVAASSACDPAPHSPVAASNPCNPAPRSRVAASNPCNPAPHSPVAASSRSATKQILFVGRLVPIKGADVAVDAMHHVHSPATLIIAGDGPERTRLEAAAARTVRDPRVSFAGAVDVAAPVRSEPGATRVSFVGAVDAAARDVLLARAACVVIPSRVLPNGRSEGTPMIALEALAAGVPVIASAVGGLRELPGIQRVRPDDPQALAAAIDAVLSSSPPAVDMSRFNWSHVSAQLHEHAMARRCVRLV